VIAIGLALTRMLVEIDGGKIVVDENKVAKTMGASGRPTDRCPSESHD
jgi:hypothetical protein